MDGVLYSCDFSDKLSSSDPNTPLLLLDDVVSRGTGIRAEKAKKRLDATRKCLQDKTRASKALSAAYKLSKSIVKDFTPDPASVAGVKRRRSFDESSSGSPNSTASSIVSIPLSKTKKTSNHQTITTNDKHTTPTTMASSRKKHTSSPEKKQLENMTTSSTSNEGHATSDYKPCLCKRSASSLIGSGGKGWEGAALITHGSKLRFGCIQLVLSLSNKPGYNELQQALTQHNLL